MMLNEEEGGSLYKQRSLLRSGKTLQRKGTQAERHKKFRSLANGRGCSWMGWGQMSSSEDCMEEGERGIAGAGGEDRKAKVRSNIFGLSSSYPPAHPDLQ